MEAQSRLSSADPAGTNLSDTLTISNKPFSVKLTDKLFSWWYKTKQPFSDKQTKTWACKNRVLVEEILAVEYVEKTAETKNGDIEMVSVNATAFRIHIIKRAPKHIWRTKSVEIYCSSSAQCALWVDSIRSLLDKYTNRPKSLLVFINPYGGRKKARKVFDEKVASIFDLAGITSHVIITERANHAKDYIMSRDLSRYDGIVCVGGDGMFAELLNGILWQYNSSLGIDLHDSTALLKRPDIRIGVIPAGSTDTVAYCTSGINDAITSALHIVVGDSMAIDVCSVRHGYSGQLLRFCVSMLAYGFYGDVLRDSETFRWMGPNRYNYSGFRTFLKNKSYQADISYLPSQALQTDHHPLQDGSRCYTGCSICKSASLLDLNGSIDYDGSISPALPDDNVDALSSLTASLTNVSLVSRQISTLSNVSPDSWTTVSGKYIGINALTISCRCATVPEGVSPACHLGDGSADLVMVHEASRLDYFRHLLRIQAKTSSQFDFNFVKVVRAKAFKVRVPSAVDPIASSAAQTASSFQRLDEPRNLMPVALSTWNCDGEIIEEPNIDVRVHCQLVKLFARGIEESYTKLDQCTSTCISCAEET
ncbi:ceramide kinase-like [Watersipora subatra]|uniref:ceramide kinase-like n=1 Tax=Watersipora subatra TaxID=2589382 RepID=UPI00355C2016